jgi:hypothetical protein
MVAGSAEPISIAIQYIFLQIRIDHTDQSAGSLIHEIGNRAGTGACSALDAGIYRISMRSVEKIGYLVAECWLRCHIDVPPYLV